MSTQIQFYNDKILFVDGKVAMDPRCCCVLPWVFSDMGLIDGGQEGAFRLYTIDDIRCDTSSIQNSPWSFSDCGYSLRLNWEGDNLCDEFGPYINVQEMTATLEIFVPENMVMKISIDGMVSKTDTLQHQLFIFVDDEPLSFQYPTPETPLYVPPSYDYLFGYATVPQDFPLGSVDFCEDGWIPPGFWRVPGYNPGTPALPDNYPITVESGNHHILIYALSGVVLFNTYYDISLSFEEI